MSDTISRQAAIDRINKQREHLQPDIYPQDKIGDAAYRICAEFIERLPSAEPQIIACGEGELSTNLAEVGTDLISRQQAIDTLRGYLVGKRCPDDGTLTCRLIENEVINKLPPAQPEPLQPWEVLAAQAVLSQPEIIRCKDCRYFKQVFAPNDNDGLLPDNILSIRSVAS